MKKFFLSIIFIIFFSFPVFSAKKYIYSQREYSNYVLKLLKTKLKRFENRIYLFENGRNVQFGKKIGDYAACYLEINFTVNDKEQNIKLNLLDPPYKIDRDIKKIADDFSNKKENFSTKTYYLIFIKDYFYNNPEPIDYVWNLTLNASDVFKYRMGNCFAITNYFIAITRYLGFKSYYYYFPYTQSSYISNDVLITTSHIVCGVEVGNRDMPFIIDYLPDANISYRKLFKLKKVKKITDLQASGLFYSNLGVKMMLLKNFGTAEFLLSFAENLYPESANIKNNLGVLYKNLKNYKKAIDCFLKAIALTDDFQKIMPNILKIEKYLNEKERQIIREKLNDALEKNYFWHLKKADAYMEEKNFKKALKEIKKADRLSPDNQEVYIYFLKLASKTNNEKLYKKYSKKIIRLK